MYERTHVVTPLLAALLLALGAAAFSARAGADGSTQGEPPEGTTAYILLNKPPKQGRRRVKGFPGVQVFARENTVAEADNPTTKANGHLGQMHIPNCACLHLHGTLFGKDDPDEERCGWGCVIPVASAPPAVQTVSRARMREERAIAKIDSNDLAGALQDVLRSIDALRDAQLHPPTGGDWGAGDGRKYQKNLGDAEKLDNAAADSIREAQNENDPGKKKNKLKNAKEKLEEAIQNKAAETFHMAKKLGLIPGRDDD